MYFTLKLKRMNVFVVISEIHKQYLYFKYILKKKYLHCLDFHKVFVFELLRHVHAFYPKSNYQSILKMFSEAENVLTVF